MSDRSEDFGARLDALVAEAAALAETFECREPAYGVPGSAHCAACCYGTLIAATCVEELEVAKALHEVVHTGRALQEWYGQRVHEPVPR